MFHFYRNSGLFSLVILILSINNIASAGQSPDEFATRRNAIFDTMNDNSVLIMRALEPSEEFNFFRQENNFYYLTGVTEPNSTLIIAKKSSGDNGSYDDAQHAFLFIQERNNDRADWDPVSLGIEGAQTELGFQQVLPYRDFQEVLEETLHHDNYSTVYMDYSRSKRLTDPLTADEALFHNARERGANFEVMSPVPLVLSLREIKSDSEIILLKTAINVTAEAHKEAMRSIKPGIKEYQLQAVIEHVFAVNNSKPGFSSIIASGPNTVVLHWDENSRTIEDEDLVVVDIGAEYSMYTADITRTIPVNGIYSHRQREIYSLVLAAQQAGIDLLKPGAQWSEINKAVNETLRKGLKKLGMIEEDSELRKYYYHGLGHGIGLYVHDNTNLSTLEAGMVITVEPGIYILEEGLGVRVEDNFLITEFGYIHLSYGAPRSIDKIESIMKESGTNFQRYLLDK